MILTGKKTFIEALDERTALVKDQMAKESAALDARTEKLRAQRLEQEAQEAQEAKDKPDAKPR